MRIGRHSHDSSLHGRIGPRAGLWLFVFALVGCVPVPTSDSYTPFGLGDLTGLSPTPVGASGTDAGDDGDVVAGISNDGADGIASVLASEFPTCRTFAQADLWRNEVLELVNQEREREGLSPVRRNATLEAQAEQYACEMIHYNFFAHDNPVTGSTLRDRNRDFGYPFLRIGENLAAGQRSPEEVMNGWMNSPGHRANILNPDFIDLGIGIRSGGSYGYYWVQEFGSPAAVPVRIGEGRTDTR